MDPAIYGELHERLCAETDAVIQLTTGGSPRLPVEERLNTVLLSPEMCSLNMGLLNFFIRGEQVFFANHRSDIERFAHEIAARDVRPELEVYSAAMLEEVAAPDLGSGSSTPPYVINLVLHTPTQGGTRGTPENLLDVVARLRALGVPWEDLRINVTSMGPTQLPMTTIAMAMGLNVRVGMEDNVLYRRGEPLREQRAAGRAGGADRRPSSTARSRRPSRRASCSALRGREEGALPESRRAAAGCGMKPPPFAYAAPTEVDEALELLAADGARVLAGGQSLVPLMSARLEHPAALVDINRLAELGELERQRRRDRRRDRPRRPARARPRRSRARAAGAGRRRRAGRPSRRAQPRHGRRQPRVRRSRQQPAGRRRRA